MTGTARARAVGVALVGWLLAFGVTAGPAAAHAELVSTTPGAEAQLDTAPTEVRLQFSEAVSLGAGYARVLDGDAERVDTGAPAVEGDTVTIPLRDELPDGGYLVTYRVISADSHPVSGAFGFVVGDAEPVDQALADAADDSDPFVAGLLVGARWLGFAGLALGLGVPAFLLLCWPAGWAVARLRRLAAAGAAAIAAGGLLMFLLQGPYAAGSGLGALAAPDLLATTASSTYGRTLLARVVLALLLLAALRFAPRRAAVIAGAVLALGLIATTAAVGHPVAGAMPVLAVVVTSVHVAAMALWLGGLVTLLAGLLRPGVAAGDLARALPRFSRLAFGSVAALVLTGVVQTVREVGTPAALFTTTYGWVLVAKVALVLLVLGAAGVARVWVQQHLGGPRPRRGGRRVTAHAFSAEAESLEVAAQARAAAQADAAVEDVVPFRRSVLLEGTVVAVVLLLSAVLAGTPPARSAVADPVDATLALEGAAGTDGTVQLSVVPAQAGPNTLHVYLFDENDRLTQPQAIRVTLTEPQQQIGPLEVDLEPAGPGHYIGDGMSIPTAGTWTLAVTVRLDEFTATTARTTFPVR
ncbi:copper resistance CopC/CopD family protein [Blastococcus capsensis]|uniref:copper resistance CopC/CopD family protein n=1 Tax=Blastococcus capsensis TaxID=1564163 RepID=UPI002541623C|nr:copper resistance protein CopC [Blastococcus capsensis]MDK3256343.1 copper resistance protein CopC [Blastococcus capsensis]